MIIIRKANLSDANDIAKMHADSFIASLQHLVPKSKLLKINPEGFKNRWGKRLSDDSHHAYIARNNKSIVGIINLALNSRTTYPEIAHLYIHPDYWRKGIGKKLMLFAIRLMRRKGVKKVKVWALKTNPKSRAFYESLGAYTTGIERKEILESIPLIEVLYYIDTKIASQSMSKNDDIKIGHYKKLAA